MNKLITTESVSFGHPDKIADQISDAVLDLFLTKDPNSKVAVETMVKNNHVIIGGEVKCSVFIPDSELNETILDVVRTFNFSEEHGFNVNQIKIQNLLSQQSPEINAAVDNGEFVGAGDQGFMTGYATNETPNFMPIGMYVAKKLAIYITEETNYGPDAKTQVTVEYDSDNKVVGIHTILISAMHPKTTSLDSFRVIMGEAIKSNVMDLSDDIFNLITDKTILLLNPAGSWNVGGPVSDCGVTGRKIVVDQYGPYCPVGGGAFSGKDFSKIDRSGAYLCRYIAKNIVASGLADKVRVEIAYAIGIAEPISINVDTYSTGKISDEELIGLVFKLFPLTPQAIESHFDLKRPIYYELARYGHYGYSSLPWEKTDKSVELIQAYQLKTV